MKYVNTEHRVMADAFDDDQLALGLKADGIAGIISTGLAGSVAWILSRFTPFEPAIGAFGGSLIGAVSYVIFAMNRNKKRLEHLAENEELRKKMALQYSSKLSEGGESLQLQEWNKIKLQIASGVLTESNQRILELELVVKHNITETVTVSGVAEEKYGELYAKNLESEKLSLELKLKLEKMENEQNEERKKLHAQKSIGLAAELEKSGFNIGVSELLGLGEAAFRTANYEMSRGYFSQSRMVSRNSGDLKIQEIAVYNLFKIAKLKGELKEQENLSRQWVELTIEMDDTGAKAEALHALASVLYNQGEKEEAEKWFIQCINLAKEENIGVVEFIATVEYCTLLMGLVIQAVSDGGESEKDSLANPNRLKAAGIMSKLLDKFPDIPIEIPDKVSKYQYVGLMGLAFNKASEEELLDALKVCDENGFKLEKVRILNSLARIAESQGNAEMVKIHDQESQKIKTEIGLLVDEEE